MKKKITKKKVVKARKIVPELIKTPFPIKIVVEDAKAPRHSKSSKKVNVRGFVSRKSMAPKDFDLSTLDLVPMPPNEQKTAREMFERLSTGKTAGYIVMGEVKSRDKEGEDVLGLTHIQHMHKQSLIQSIAKAIEIQPMDLLGGLLGNLGLK